MFGDAYSGRRVFVTGHTGFKGAWLASWLLELGAEVTGYALDPATEPNLFDALDLGSRVRHVVADIRDQGRLMSEMLAARPSVVFHLAAQPLVRLSYAEPHETFATNIMGTVNLLEAVRGCDSVSAAVIVTSDKCYRNSETRRAFREDDPMGGLDPYSASKGCAELVTNAYRQSFFDASSSPAIASVRAGNVIGGGDWAADRIIPDCVRALSVSAPVIVRNPDAVRPWQHVLEPLAGYLEIGARLVAEGSGFAGPWNFGPTDDDAARPVRWVVERFVGEWGEGSWTTSNDAAVQPREAEWLSLDSDKARGRLGWEPVWDAAHAVRHTARWYRDYYRRRDVACELLDEQLRSYQDDARAAGLAWAVTN